MDKLKLHILGCGSATVSSRHMPTCQVLDVRDNLFMIDCGEGAQRELMMQRIKFTRLNHIFISHLHGDHCFGLPGLLSTLDLHGRTGPLTIHINAEGAKHFGDFFDFFLKKCSYKIEFNVVGSRKAVVYEDDAITVTALPLKHRVPTMGYLFEEKPKLRHIIGDAVKFHNIPIYAYDSLRRGDDFTAADGTVIANSLLTTDADPSLSYAYCSDTAFSQRLINMLHQPTWIYHEATYGNEFAKLARQRGHSTAREAAIVARETGAKNLILGHYSKRYPDETPLLLEAQEEFSGRVLLANEGMNIDLTK